MKRKRKSLPFVQIFNEVLESEAYKKLSHASFRAYVHIRAKYNGGNGGNLSFTYREASRLMNRRTYKKAIDRLVERGLIEVVGSGKGYARLCNIYGLSEKWRSYGTPGQYSTNRIVVADTF